LGIPERIPAEYGGDGAPEPEVGIGAQNRRRFFATPEPCGAINPLVLDSPRDYTASG